MYLEETRTKNKTTVNTVKRTHFKRSVKLKSMKTRTYEKGEVLLSVLHFSDGRGFVMCVAVRVQKDLDPHEASSREEALQAAYCSLLQGLSLGPPPTAGTLHTLDTGGTTSSYLIG